MSRLKMRPQFLQNDEIELFRKHERTGRPIGVPAFIEDIEQLLNRNFKPQKPGPKNKVQ